MYVDQRLGDYVEKLQRISETLELTDDPTLHNEKMAVKVNARRKMLAMNYLES